MNFQKIFDAFGIFLNYFFTFLPLFGAEMYFSVLQQRHSNENIEREKNSKSQTLKAGLRPKKTFFLLSPHNYHLIQDKLMFTIESLPGALHDSEISVKN